MEKVAQFLRRYPWIVPFALRIWRLGRPRFTAGVVGVVTNDAGEVLVVEHVFHPKIPWGLPGGWVDRAERLDETLARELREELSLPVTVGRTLLVELNPKHRYHMDIAFHCTPQGEVGAVSNELLGYAWHAPATLPDIPPFHRRAIEAWQPTYPIV